MGPTRAHRGMALCWHIDVKSPNAMAAVYVQVHCMVSAKGCGGVVSSEEPDAEGSVGRVAGWW